MTSIAVPTRLTDEQCMLRDSLQRLLQELSPFEHRRQRLLAATPDRMALWAPLTELGVIGAALGETDGGFDGSASTVAMLMEEIGRSLLVEPFLASAVVAARLSMHAGRDREALLAPIADGSAVWVLAHDAGDDPFAPPRLQARRDGKTISVSGILRCIRHADVADGFLVPLLLDGDTALYRLPAGTPGLHMETYRLIDGAGAGDLHLQALGLTPSMAVPVEGDVAAALAGALEWGLLGLVAETAGIVSALNLQTFEYLKARRQFGAPLASFQALQHRAADMFIAAEELAAILATLIETFSEPPSPQRARAVSAAKVVADGAGRRVGNEAVQMHGGMGVSDELVVSHYFRRLAAIRRELGAADLHRLRFREQTA